MSDKAYLGKVFANVKACEKEIQLDVQGHLPDWLKGSLIRLGPGLFDLSDDFSVNHFFDGAAILYKYNFGDDHKVWFKSKFLDTTAYQKMIQLKRPIFTEFGTCCYPDTTRGLFHRMLNKFVPSDLTDNVHGNIYRIGDEYFCASETCKVWKINPDSLEAIEKVDLSKENRVTLASPHPLIDESGNVYNIGASFTLGLKYHIMKIDAPRNQEESNICQLTRTTDLTRLSPKSKTLFSYAHSFGMSQNYVILIEQPLLINSLKLITMTAKRQALREAFEWHGQKEKTQFHVIDKSTGRSLKTSFLSEPFFFLHVINSYEDNDHIVIDIICYKDHEILNKFDLSNLRSKEPIGPPEIPSVRRYVIPLTGIELAKNDENLVKLSYTDAQAKKLSDTEIILTPEILLKDGFENPSIDKRLTGKKYQFVYGGASFEPYEHSNSLIKFDTMTKNMVIWKGTSYQFPGEALFIQNPSGTEEDDGVIFSIISDVQDNAHNFLLVLNSSNFTELARIMIPEPAQVCPSVHGIWKF